MEISNISVSRYQTFKECRTKYRFRYELKVIPEKPEQIYFSYGKIVHKIAEHYVLNKGKISINEIAADVLSKKIPIEEPRLVPLTDEYRRKLKDHLISIKNFSDKIGYEGEIEWPFNFDLQPPNNKMVKGFIDRLIVKDSGYYFIIDYKTSKKNNWRKNSSTIKGDLQLRTYARIVQKTFNIDASKIKAALFYVEGAELVSTNFTNSSLQKAEEELIHAYDLIKEIPSEDAWGNVGSHCSRCDYNDICPFIQSQLTSRN